MKSVLTFADPVPCDASAASVESSAFPGRQTARVKRDVDEELRFHLDMKAQELIDAGAAPNTAYDRARAPSSSQSGSESNFIVPSQARTVVSRGSKQ